MTRIGLWDISQIKILCGAFAILDKYGFHEIDREGMDVLNEVKKDVLVLLLSIIANHYKLETPVPVGNGTGTGS